MRKPIMVLLFCSCYAAIWAQPNNDSLIAALAKGQPDTTRVLLLSELALGLFHKPDSMALLADQALEMATKTNFKKGIASALLAKGTCYVIQQNNAQALEHYLEALTLAQKIEDDDLIAEANQNIGNVYSWAKEYQVSNNYFYKTKEYVEKTDDDLWLAGTLLSIGGNFERLNILDSARHYIQQANELSLKLKFPPLTMNVLLVLGDIHAKMGMDKLALEYYRLSHNESRMSNSLDGISMVATSMAQLYESKGFRDSSFYYAKLSIDTEKKLNRQPALSSLALVVNFYKDHGQVDSAFFYHQKWAVVKDSLFGEEQTKQLQTLSFHESVREKEIAEENVRREKERVNNLQVMAIGTFIITCFIFLFLVSKRKTKPKTIEIYGGIALLLAFEFISLLLHPFIERITHHTPVLVFLFLVAIASILVPLHHKLEKIVKEKLAQKLVVTPNIEGSPESPPVKSEV